MNSKHIICLMHFNELSDILKDYIGKTEWIAYGNPYIDKNKYVFNEGSLRLNGPNYIYSVDSKLLNFFNTTNEFTIDFWVRYDGVDRLDYETAFSLYTTTRKSLDTDYRSLEICKWNNGRPLTSIGRVSYYSIWNAATPSYGTWFHVAAILKDNILKTYLNGKLVSSMYRLGIYTEMVVIGGGGSSHQVGLYGNIDELRICDVAIWDNDFDVESNQYSCGNHKLYLNKNNIYSLV